jgi:2-oxoacid:acceptor oxidoreductase gamma subunit (pyruvate/2-ketoisovalerate family)/2-oxoacid:acceptor oxidoreductase delta subunit (pyruvate/2-ketoisovalerate family)
MELRSGLRDLPDVRYGTAGEYQVEMQEMLIVGRGGEGVVLASQILADTFARAGYWVQSFPEFKAERRGAPISAFLRWDESSPIRRRYKVRECDVLAVVSPSPPSPLVMAAVKPGGLMILNRETRFPHTGEFDVARVPASRIARRHGVLSSEGRPMGNVAVLGACVRLLVPHGLPFLEEAIASRMGALAEANVLAAREGYARCTRQHTLAGDTPVGLADLAPAASRPTTPLYPVSTTDSRRIQTGAWSLDRPVLTTHCTACALCALFCPEGAITRVDGTMVVDYLHCKGCGICEVVCPIRDAVEMEEVPA